MTSPADKMREQAAQFDEGHPSRKALQAAADRLDKALQPKEEPMPPGVTFKPPTEEQGALARLAALEASAATRAGVLDELMARVSNLEEQAVKLTAALIVDDRADEPTQPTVPPEPPASDETPA